MKCIFTSMNENVLNNRINLLIEHGNKFACNLKEEFWFKMRTGLIHRRIVFTGIADMRKKNVVQKGMKDRWWALL